jgi:pyrroline-5-carboxylate reductase
MEHFRNKKVAILGAGIIGGAMAQALAPYCEVTATRRDVEKLRHLEKMEIRITSDNRMAAEEAEIIILAVKPKQMVPVLLELRGALEQKTVISMAAAIPLEIMKETVPEAHYIRGMTNTAVQIRRAFTIFTCGPDVTARERDLVRALFRHLGEFEEVEEQYLDVLTAMSGSGPAYLYTVLEAMIYGALRVGLPRDLALKAAAHTFIGAAHHLLSSDKHPAELRDQVVTPGGVTIEGIYELEDGRIRTAFMKAVSAASQKATVIAAGIREHAREQLHEENQKG